MVKYFKIIVILLFIFFVIVNYLNIRDISLKTIFSIFSYEKYIHNKNNKIIHELAKTNNNHLKCDLLLIGDSHLANINTQTFKPYTTHNVSINGETTEGILLRFKQNLSNITHKKTIIFIGYNDLKTRSSNKTIENYTKIFKKLNSNYIIIISLLPVSNKRTIINKEIQKINHYLYNYCIYQKNYTYIDVYKLLLNPNKDGIDSKFTTDGIHLNNYGNKILINELLKHI